MSGTIKRNTPMEFVMMYSQVGRAAREFFAHKMGYDFETVDQRWGQPLVRRPPVLAVRRAVVVSA
jgi:hypothetical protein